MLREPGSRTLYVFNHSSLNSGKTDSPEYGAPCGREASFASYSLGISLARGLSITMQEMIGDSGAVAFIKSRSCATKRPFGGPRPR